MTMTLPPIAEIRASHRTVGISDLHISSTTTDVIVTHSLGSCVGLTLYDPALKIGGMVHCLLPLSSLDAEKAKQNPAMFTDTGVSALIQKMFDLGADRKRIIAKAAGCSCLLDEKGTFRIGERNNTILRKVLWKNNIMLAGDEVGGTIPRTLYLYIDTGRTVVRSQGSMREI